ncbi:DgyrCDS8318 [Dimorphilus gyrociliatus]|uniref:DgyrCDS8318 n=1 Tax=Dimorphilus gyrociliatus TaxID=2664684 RepID=A0A7I8VW05_9ANNE|nr:DgyrCDS8318 [Dimorphilus gyrociliatus]
MYGRRNLYDIAEKVGVGSRIDDEESTLVLWSKRCQYERKKLKKKKPLRVTNEGEFPCIMQRHIDCTAPRGTNLHGAISLSGDERHKSIW